MLDLVGNPDMFARDTAHMCMPTISAALVEGTIFTMHGGLSPDLTSLEQVGGGKQILWIKKMSYLYYSRNMYLVLLN